MTLLSVADAYATIMEHRLPLATEEVPLEQAAGRILAQTILADRDYPPISRATMDGIAV
ncbi:MAG: molybdopterin molybdenumtransferase MoeA, partial [Kiritimatiellia bacterium]